MRKLLISSMLVVAAACTVSHDFTPTTPAAVEKASFPPPPATEAKPVTDTYGATSITDPYRWLEDQNAPETRTWIDRENAYTDQVLDGRPEIQPFATRIAQLLNSDLVTTPIMRGGRLFFRKRAAGADVISIYMREGLNGTDQVLIDPSSWSPTHTTNVGMEDITSDGKLMAYYVRQGGADETVIRFFDVDAKKDIGVELPLARYFGVNITRDKRTLYYSKQLAEGSRIFRRAFDGGAEEKIFGDGYTPDKIVGVSMSENGRWLAADVSYGSAGTKSELYVKDLSVDGPFKTVVNDIDARTGFDFAGDMLILATNWNAPNVRVMAVDAANPGRANWRELVPENKNAAMESASAVGGRVYVRYIQDVKPRVVGYDLSGHQVDDISFDTLGTLADLSGSWSSPVAFYSFSSFATPATIYTYNVDTKARSIFNRANLPVNPDDFTVEQVWYPSKDGTKIPMFLMYKKGLVRNGTAHTYLTGYGGFNSSMTPNFSSSAVAWAEQGGIWALANLRGGGEFGEAWHKAGMFEQKQNVFDDFIAAAEYLEREKYTSPQHLAVAGTSNGGLLVMAMTTQRPDLVHAVYCGYPLVDMLRFHRFLVGSFWVAEYGSADVPSQFPYIYAYSPYQHVKKGEKYPSVLFVSGDADTRVAPLHARKMTALLQNSTGSSNPILLRYHTSGGHSGGEPVNVQVKNTSESLGFLWWQTE